MPETGATLQRLPSVPADVLEFLAAYREAFNQLDGVAVAALYAKPAGIVSNLGYTHWERRDQVAPNMVALCELYRRDGFLSTDFVIEAFRPLGRDSAFVDLRWTIRRSQSEGDVSFNTAYNLLREDGAWRVLLCTAYSETPPNRQTRT